MPEKTKRKKDFDKAMEKETAELPVKQPEDNLKDTWSRDQQEKSYYYDDSYGYEITIPTMKKKTKVSNEGLFHLQQFFLLTASYLLLT